MKIKEKSEVKQMSEAFITSAALAFSGGFQDAYTYNIRDGVFSNAQTGNIVLMTQHLMIGKFSVALDYIFPITSFALGVLLAEQISGKLRESQRLHWRQFILLIEIAILFIVGFIPGELNMVATALVSFACAMQVQTFRKVNGYSYASTMCIGNLRSGTAALSSYIRDRKKHQLEQALYYYGIILTFAFGAGIGGNLSIHFGYKMIWVCSAFLLIAFFLMFLGRKK